LTKFSKSILFVLIVIVAISCVPSKPVYVEEVLPADRLVKKLEANRRKIKTFEGSGILNVKSTQIEAKATFEVYLKKPDSLKFIIYGPFGIDLAQALVTNSEFTFHDIMKNVVYKGRSDSNILKKIFHIDLSFSELVDAFAGAVNLTDKLRLEPDDFNLSDNSYKLAYYDSLAGKQSEYQIQINNLAITNYKLYKMPNILMFEGIYSDFETINRVAIPYITTIENKLNNQKVTIDYRNIEVNEKINNLTLDIPSDAKIKEW
jgi:outer membrane lipoprotein-sorting protein